MSVKVGQSLTFEPEIPDQNASKLSNKFIPMQLRTQPSNLGIGQLQRVNTTLLGDITGWYYTVIQPWYWAVTEGQYYIARRYNR